MNVFKFYKYSLIFRNAYKFYNNGTNPKRYFNPKLLLNSSLLTWFGFTLNDNNEEEKTESELITTIKRAILCQQRGELPKAEQMLHLALRLAQEQQNKQGILYIYDLMANVALERGEAEKAEKLFVVVLQRLLNEDTKQDDIKVIHISLKMARICQMKNDLEKAEIGYQWCLDSIKKKLESEENNSDIRALNGLIQDYYAHYLSQKGQIHESLTHLEEAFRICTELEGESENSIRLLNDIGTTSWKLGDLKNAEQYFTKAIQMGKNIENSGLLGVIYANLGLVHLQNGVVNKAKFYCKEGLRFGNKQQNEDAVSQANYCFEQIKNHKF